MGLSCSCDYGDEYAWYYTAPDDYQELSTKRCRRCSSCKQRIAVGDLCAEFPRHREARHEVEIAIYGEGDIESIWLASYWLCETCADLWFSLDELGFKCVAPDEHMPTLVQEYAAMQWR